MLFGKFYSGFVNFFKDVWKLLFNKYQELRLKKKCFLFLIGYSFGGVIVIVVVAELIDKDLFFIFVYIFG